MFSGSVFLALLTTQFIKMQQTEFKQALLFVISVRKTVQLSH